MGQLDGRTVLITGAARGIGAACARRLAAEGARLVLADLDAGVEKVAAELGQVAVRADVTRRDDIERMVEEPYRRWGRLDVLFNNAGVIRVQPMLDVTEAEWDRVMTVNLRAVFFVLQAVSRRMVRQDPIAGSELRGKLIQTASSASPRIACVRARSTRPCGSRSTESWARSKAWRRARRGNAAFAASRWAVRNVRKTWRASSRSWRARTPTT
jgi:NAD(P)-dependent dehydrogenase (short-subunit alcohol dehydrogenase family)